MASDGNTLAAGDVNFTVTGENNRVDYSQFVADDILEGSAVRTKLEFFCSLHLLLTRLLT